MERPVKGDVVVVPFPFSDLSASKKRPALVVASLDGDDVVLCQITSEARNDEYSIPLLSQDFVEGGLRVASTIKPNKLFTADRSLILYKAGMLKEHKIREVEKAVVSIFTN